MFKKIGSIFFITLFFISGNSVFAGAIDKRPQFVKDFEEGRFDYFKNQSIAPLKIRNVITTNKNNDPFSIIRILKLYKNTITIIIIVVATIIRLKVIKREMIIRKRRYASLPYFCFEVT